MASAFCYSYSPFFCGIHPTLPHLRQIPEPLFLTRGPHACLRPLPQILSGPINSPQRPAPELAFVDIAVARVRTVLHRTAPLFPSSVSHSVLQPFPPQQGRPLPPRTKPVLSSPPARFSSSPHPGSRTFSPETFLSTVLFLSGQWHQRIGKRARFGFEKDVRRCASSYPQLAFCIHSSKGPPPLRCCTSALGLVLFHPRALLSLTHFPPDLS